MQPAYILATVFYHEKMHNRYNTFGICVRVHVHVHVCSHDNLIENCVCFLLGSYVDWRKISDKFKITVKVKVIFLRVQGHSVKL